MFANVNFSPKSVHGTPECVTVHRDFLFLGTREGKVIVYNTSQCRDSAENIYLTNVFTTTKKLAVRSLLVVDEKDILTILVGDTVVTYSLRSVTQSSGGGRATAGAATATEASRFQQQQQPVQALEGLKDVVSVHIKKQKGRFTMAVLMSRKAAFFDYSDETTWRCTSTKGGGFSFSDVASGFAWAGRNAIVQLRRTGAVALTISTGDTEPLPVPHQGPLSLIELDPFSELLMCDNAGGRRVFPNGTPVPDTHALSWPNGAPALASYAHPFLLSVQPPATQLQVWLPLLSVPHNGDGGSGGTLATVASTAAIVKLGAKNFTNFDNVPDATNQSTKVAFLDARNTVHMLVRHPMSSVVAALMKQKKFAEALLLSQLCASELDEKVAHQVLVQSAVDQFAHRRYTAALQQLRSCHADPFVALALFSDLVPPGLWDALEFVKSSGYFSSSSSSSFSSEGKQPCDEDAFPPFIDYLNYVRRAVENERNVFPTRDPSTLLPVVYVTLTRLCARLLREEELADIVREVKDNALKHMMFDFLRNEGEWTVLLNLFHRFEMHAEAMNMLSSLARIGSWDGHGVTRDERMSPAPSRATGDSSKDPVLCDALMSLSESEAGGALPSIKTIAPHQVRDLLAKSGVGSPPSDALALRVAGVLNALGYLRSLSLKSSNERDIFKAHVSWLFGLIPVAWVPFPFLAQSNKSLYDEALHVLSCYEDRADRHNAKSEVVVAYLSAVAGDHQCKDPHIHNAYWKNTSLLLFCGLPPPSMSARRKAQMRESLCLFLEQTPYADLQAARAFFEGPDLRTVCMAERAIIYRRLRLHEEAFAMYLSEEGSGESGVNDAKAYAQRAQQGGDGTAYGVLLKYASSEPVTAAHPVIDVLDLLPLLVHCDGIDALSLLSFLPDTTPFHDVAALLLRSLRFATASVQRCEVDASALRLYNANTTVEKAGLDARKVTIDADSCCAVCGKRFRADTTFLYFPSGVLVHEACAKDEHICPVSGTDFRAGLNAFMGHC